MSVSDASVTDWLRQLKAGDQVAAQRLWDVFFPRLVGLAQRRMMPAHRTGVEAEDLALSAFASFCRGIENQRFDQISDRHSLWRLLVGITIHKLLHVHRDQQRLKRGGAFQQVDTNSQSDEFMSAVHHVVGREPTPELAAEIAEQYSKWMAALQDEELVRIAQWKLEGFTNEEIAAMCGRTMRTVERKLNLIRKTLSHELNSDH